MTGPINSPRTFHTATLLPDGRVLVAGGYVSSSPYASASAERYDPATGAWTPTGLLNKGRAYHTANLLPNGKVLVAGGSSGIFDNPTNTVELYDPAGTGAWNSFIYSLTTNRTYCHAVLLPNGRVLTAGGYVGGTNVATSAEVYDPISANFLP